MMWPLAPEVVERPFPVAGTLRRWVVMRARLVRNATAVFVAPRPTTRRALFIWRRRRMRMRSTSKKTTTLLIPEFIFLAAGWIRMVTLPTAMIGGLRIRRIRFMGRRLAAEGGGRPIPATGALRRMVRRWMRIMRNTAAVFPAP